MTGGHPGASRRLIGIDVLRGVAILLMVAFHFFFDLSYFGLADFDFYRDPFWLHARTFILSLFLGLVGASLVLATQRGLNARRFLRRLGLLVASAALVTLATWWLFDERFVFFGVLHFIALASVPGLAFVRFPWLALVSGVVLILFANRYQFSWFDTPGWRWIGLMTHKPATEDYVPLLPWFGVVLLGIFAGHQLHRPWLRRVLESPNPARRSVRYLSLAGRHSLPVYLVHQPVLLGLLSVWTSIPWSA